MNFLKKRKIHNQKRCYFAIPQIFILGIAIAMVSGLMAASILGLTGSRTQDRNSCQASSYSGITKLRSLFNDNSEGRLFNYFWLVDNCSDKAVNVIH